MNDKFLGKIVYLKTDPDQLKRVCTCKLTYLDNHVEYEVKCGNEQSYHFETELSLERKIEHMFN